ncbi:MAG: hypothetical protein KDI19_12000 [Pseudomonadales bacterium]|nr:hypothetical protein [Pseudomonadales bacterium]
MTDHKALQEQSDRFEKIAEELNVAADHARITAKHYRNAEVARAGAHAFALQGHVSNARELFHASARLHASKARTEGAPDT